MSRVSVLIVDDDIALVTLYKAVLKRHLPAMRVEATNDPSNALIMLRQEGPFDLVLTDLAMPGLRGEEFINRIRAGDTEGDAGTPRDVAVGCVATLPPPDDRDFAFFLRKPFGIEQLVEIVSLQVGSA